MRLPKRKWSLKGKKENYFPYYRLHFLKGSNHNEKKPVDDMPMIVEGVGGKAKCTLSENQPGPGQLE